MNTSFIEINGHFLPVLSIDELTAACSNNGVFKYTPEIRVKFNNGKEDKVIQINQGFSNGEKAKEYAIELIKTVLTNTDRPKSPCPSESQKITLGRVITVYKDGGSAIYEVKNTSCGYTSVFYDGGISSSTRGRYFDSPNKKIDLTDLINL